jgi:hypothetical protein
VEESIMAGPSFLAGHRRGLGVGGGLVLAAGLWACLGPCQRACAQGGRYPNSGYYQAFNDFYDGNYENALKEFVAQSRMGIRTAQSRWIDSICYEAMIGECYYEMGHLNEALEHYTFAVQLAAAFPDWMLRVNFPAIQAAGASVRRAVPWGASTRGAKQGLFPQYMSISQGQIDITQQMQQGGMVTAPTLVPIDVAEIVRCTTLAIRRRTKLLGPLAARDPLFGELVGKLQGRIGPPNHWSEAWVGAELGVAQAAVGREGQAVLTLQRAVVAGGEFDHPLTATALFELGRLAMLRGDMAAAANLFREASYSAAYYPLWYPNAALLEECFRYGQMTHLMANSPGIYPLLADETIRWAETKHFRQLYVSLLLLRAESHLVRNETALAAIGLEKARTGVSRRSMGNGRIGARYNFLNGTFLFQQKKVADGDAAIAAAMRFMQYGSHWLFQISLADALAANKATPRTAMELYQTVLRDPLPADWASDPMESLAVLVTPHPLPYEHWFNAALARKDWEAAVEIGDRMRRHRFFTSMAYGGRLESLRWVLEAADEQLDKASRVHRQDLLTRYPAYADLRRQAHALHDRLAAMPLATEDHEPSREQIRGLADLLAVSQKQEVLLREMTVRREPAGLIFPPLRATVDIQRSLPKGHALLIFVTTSDATYGFLLSRERYGQWKLGARPMLEKKLTTMLRDMGNFQQNYELGMKDLKDVKWKQAGREIHDFLLKGAQADLKFDELIIVPDGALWYLPFEALPLNVNGQMRSLISCVRVRYAPTASLATVNQATPSHGAVDSTAVVLGRLFPREDPALARNAVRRLAEVLPGTVVLRSPLPACSAVYATLLHRLIVLDDLTVNTEGGPYSWSPLPLDRGKAGSTLSDWMSLPWGGPDQIIFPGYHTAAEDSLGSLKRGKRPAAGNEIFLSVCGLMASGARTVLLSRWRVGGQTSYDLVREFAQELPHTTPADAWQRAVLVATDSRLNFDGEPRLKKETVDEPPKASHPFFWAGYMLIDPGSPAPADIAPLAPVANLPNLPGAADKPNHAAKP